ncbi:AraC family transcriptional regulator [Uliginosibacterium sp. H1]|uniref:AraC family transcriptional regulator n=1 Tax=Uliginosibacterium sp. H1 TaxID=3114757 RepID=UPI002E18BB81|nr:AraC family transcriptional regulator [Uliginosibacterium sp. H1]
MNLAQFSRRLGSLRQVANHIDARLYEPLCLDELAEVAHMSRFHFERVFADYAGETPLARVRRLRLLDARNRIERGFEGSLLDLALDCGYTSAEAFSRAFRAAHGMPPSRVPRRHVDDLPLRVVGMGAIAIQYIAFRGRMDDSLRPFEELRARAMMAGLPRERRKGWSVHLDGGGERWCDDVELQAALQSDPLGIRLPGLDLAYLPAGDYAVLTVDGGYDAPPLSSLRDRIERETGRRVADAPVLRRFNNAAYLPARQERSFELFVPVRS